MIYCYIDKKIQRRIKMTLILARYEKVKDLLIRFLAFFLGMGLCSVAPLKFTGWPHHIAPTWRYWILVIAIICGFFLNLLNEKTCRKQEDEENLRRVERLSYLILALIGYMLWPIMVYV